ncbi:DNA translocase FtsK 4TM domain-containing protein [Gymnodinialimonas sp. 2305UL16-5]|uniref:DNA translocase FtsK 4TM domain-containing protein n=1 Tax=Gymnodinialimonas mytili TaxID=3126503 RepID=UPI0030AF6F0B
MAYQTRGREPLLDQRMRNALLRRSREVIGIALLGVAVALAAILYSFVPEDPNFLAATDVAPQNLLGRTGATIAIVLMMMVGLGAWVLPLAAFVWGVRFLTHRGSNRVWSALFLPIGVVLAAFFASSYPPPASWSDLYGSGGHFGDIGLGFLINVMPLAPAVAIKIAALGTLIGTLFVLRIALGFDRDNMRAFYRFVLRGLFTVGEAAGQLLRRGGAAAGTAAGVTLQNMQHHIAVRREAQSELDVIARSEPLVHRADEALCDADSQNPVAERRPGGLFGRMPVLRREAPALEPDHLPAADPTLVEDLDYDPEGEDGDRIRSRISDAIRARVRRPSPIADAAARARVAPGTPSRIQSAARAEPPLTAAMAAADEAPMVDAEPLELSQLDPEPIPDPIPAQVAVPQPQAELNRRVVQQPTRKPAMQSRQAQADQQPSLPLSEPEPYEFPPLTLLTNPTTIERHHLSDEALEENARMLENVLDDYGVKGEITSVRPGPVVTMYELEPAPGLKASRVIGLADDIARSMSALSARVSTVPGRTVIGIELPNQNREMVVLREMLSHRDFGDGSHKLPLALGKDIGGEPVIANLAKMPHLLIAGTTGSGKSVAINTMILSLLYKLKPEDCRMIMIDPKMLELSVYDGIPHLLSPVVTDPKKAVVALKWVVGEMEERYRKMSKMGVRNIDGYNSRVKDALDKGEMFSRTFQTGFDDESGDPVFETEEYLPEKMPYIVVIVDEMADLMMVAGKEIEACIQRLAQMARASGIHLVMATQRPSVDVITGTIKANFPTRISFHVTSKVDSRTILGEMGAEQLLGMGDMLYMAGGSKITRVHGPFCSDEEVEEIVRHLKSFGPPEYASSVLDGPAEDRESDIDAVLGLNTGGNTNGEDALYDQAVAVVVKDRKCSTSYIQRKLGIGYNKAARLVEQMEDQGLVSAANHVGKREILVPEQD